MRNAEFLANEVPGVVIPEGIIARMRAASTRSREQALAEGIAIAREMVAALRGAIQGVQVSARFGKGIGRIRAVFGRFVMRPHPIARSTRPRLYLLTRLIIDIAAGRAGLPAPAGR